VQVFVLDDVDDVLDVCAEVRLRRAQVHALAEAGQGRRVDLLTFLTQKPGKAALVPATNPAAVDQDVRSHFASSSNRPPSVAEMMRPSRSLRSSRAHRDHHSALRPTRAEGVAGGAASPNPTTRNSSLRR
jgi:hypothetical protein